MTHTGAALGSQPTWGWLQHLNCTDMRKTPQPENIDWASLLACLASSPGGRPPDSADSDRPPDSGDSDESDASEDQDSTAHIREAVERAVLAMFVDSHNTGYYINSYTTKVNPGMDNVMEKLLNGVRRLRDQWDAAASNATPSAGQTPDTVGAPARELVKHARELVIGCR